MKVNLNQDGLQAQRLRKARRPLSTAQLTGLRRLRHARRLWRDQPLFAFCIMQQSYPGYTHDLFLQDLRRRTARRKKRPKTPLTRYGRYSKIQQLIRHYQTTGDQMAAAAAIAMRRIITRPYRLQVRLQGTICEYSLSAMIPYTAVENLNKALAQATDWQQVDSLVDACRAIASYGH